MHCSVLIFNICSWFNTGVHCLFLYSWSTDVQGSYYWWPGPFQKGTHHLWSSISHPHGSKILYFLTIWYSSYITITSKIESVISVTQGFFTFYSSIIIQGLSKGIVYCWFAHWLLQPATCNWHSAILNLQPVIFYLQRATCNNGNLQPVAYDL